MIVMFRTVLLLRPKNLSSKTLFSWLGSIISTECQRNIVRKACSSNARNLKWHRPSGMVPVPMYWWSSYMINLVIINLSRQQWSHSWIRILGFMYHKWISTDLLQEKSPGNTHKASSREQWFAWESIFPIGLGCFEYSWMPSGNTQLQYMICSGRSASEFQLN